MFTGFVGHEKCLRIIKNSLNDFKEYYLSGANQEGKEGHWGRVEGCGEVRRGEDMPSLASHLKNFSIILLWLSQLPNSLSQHPMFWRYCCIIVNCEVFTYKLFFTIDDFAHSTLRRICAEFGLCHALIWFLNCWKFTVKFSIIIIEGENILQPKYINDMSSF